MNEKSYDDIILSEIELFERLCDIYYTWPIDNCTIDKIWSYIGSNWDVNYDLLPNIFEKPASTRNYSLSKGLILDALERNNWNQKEAAEYLNLTPRQVNYHVKRFGIKHSSWRNNK